MAKNKKRVLVAMSGGVDSSVALIKILEQGYEAIGVTLKLWENKDKKTNKVIDSDCNSVDAISKRRMASIAGDCEDSQEGKINITISREDKTLTISSKDLFLENNSLWKFSRGETSPKPIKSSIKNLIIKPLRYS